MRNIESKKKKKKTQFAYEQYKVHAKFPTKKKSNLRKKRTSVMPVRYSNLFSFRKYFTLFIVINTVIF